MVTRPMSRFILSKNIVTFPLQTMIITLLCTFLCVLFLHMAHYNLKKSVQNLPVFCRFFDLTRLFPFLFNNRPAYQKLHAEEISKDSLNMPYPWRGKKQNSRCVFRKKLKQAVFWIHVPIQMVCAIYRTSTMPLIIPHNLQNAFSYIFNLISSG